MTWNSSVGAELAGSKIHNSLPEYRGRLEGALMLTGKTRYTEQWWVEILFDMHMARDDLKVLAYMGCMS